MSDKPKDSSARTVKPNGDLCKQMRVEKGWDVLAMAAKTGLTKKTVESVEASNHCFVCTLKAFSDAFGLPELSKLLEEPRLLPAPISGAGRVQIRIKLRLPFSNLDFTQWLISIVNKLIKLIDPNGEFEVIAVAPGSVIITLEMMASDARKTVAAFGSGELDELSFSSITTNFGHGEPVEFKAIDHSPIPSAPQPSRPTPPPPSPPQKQTKSLLGRLSCWLFGEPSKGTSDPPPYKEKGASIFEGRMQKR